MAEVGLSEVAVSDVEAAREIVPIASVQQQYNLATRSADDVLRYCEEAGIAFIPFYPLANGKLSRPDGPMERLASELGATPSQVALAWLLQRSPVMLPIPGTSSLGHLEENCEAASLSLSGEQVAELDDARSALRRWALIG